MQIGSAAPYALSLKGSAAKARQFLAFCSPAPVIAARRVTARIGRSPVLPARHPLRLRRRQLHQRGLRRCQRPGHRHRAGRAADVAPPRRLAGGARYVGRGSELVGYAETITWRAAEIRRAPAGRSRRPCQPWPPRHSRGPRGCRGGAGRAAGLEARSMTDIVAKAPSSRGAWGAEIRATLALAWPIVLTNLSQVGLATTDVVMMGWLGPDRSPPARWPSTSTSPSSSSPSAW